MHKLTRAFFYIALISKERHVYSLLNQHSVSNANEYTVS